MTPTTTTYGARPRLRDRLPTAVPEAIGAALAAIQGAVLSLLTVLAPIMAAALTATARTDDRTSWLAGGITGMQLWLLGHGVPIVIDGIRLSLIPLGVTAMAVYTVYSSTRRTGVATRVGLISGTVAYSGAVFAVALWTHATAGRVVLAVVGGAVVGAIGTGLGLVRQDLGPTWQAVAAPVRRRLNKPVVVGLRGAAVASAIVVGVAALVVAEWVIAGRATIKDVIEGIHPDLVGGLAFTLLQVSYLPNLIVWAVAWLAGAGFAVGTGTIFSPSEVVGGPMPAFPLLGALPTAVLDSSWSWFPATVLVSAGIVAGVHVHRRCRAEHWWDEPLAVGVVTVTTMIAVSWMAGAASGAMGPGRLEFAGAFWWMTGPMVGLLVGAGTALVVLPTSSAVRAEISQRLSGRRPDAF